MHCTIFSYVLHVDIKTVKAVRECELNKDMKWAEIKLLLVMPYV